MADASQESRRIYKATAKQLETISDRLLVEFLQEDEFITGYSRDPRERHRELVKTVLEVRHNTLMRRLQIATVIFAGLVVLDILVRGGLASLKGFAG